jgi:hypothetical protein
VMAFYAWTAPLPQFLLRGLCNGRLR